MGQGAAGESAAEVKKRYEAQLKEEEDAYKQKQRAYTSALHVPPKGGGYRGEMGAGTYFPSQLDALKLCRGLARLERTPGDRSQPPTAGRGALPSYTQCVRDWSLARFAPYAAPALA